MEPSCQICLIEDDEIMGEALSDRFRLEGYTCDWIKTGRAAARTLARKPYQVVICDIQLPDINGEDLYTELCQRGPTPPFVFTTGYGAVDRAVRLLKLGAYDFLTKPLDIHALLETVRKLCFECQGEAAAELAGVSEFHLGVSSAMRGIESILPRLAKTASGSVLITGESGVGKERVARALHDQTFADKQAPFVAVNCGALTETLMEAELFGSVKGAYTGSVRDKKGYFELADGGTLFLDEIGEMSPTMQVKLLRAIQERQIVRVGGETSINVNLRLVCATNQDLKKLVELGKFREDLYYRINVVHIHIPPLRERKDDILWVARRLLEDWGKANNDLRSLHASAEPALLAHPWPGNIRELKHCLERACILSAAVELTAENLFAATIPADGAAADGPLSDYLRAVERNYIESRLHANGWRIAETADSLKISRKNLWEKMKKLDIEQPARSKH
jgi:DNA-binding NtrC family response regulator